jgi:cytochrome c oxidase cbb3-type subunit 3
MAGALKALRVITVAAAAAISVSCQRERRDWRTSPSQRPVIETAARQSDLQPGGPLPAQVVNDPYNGNAYSISEGQRLFNWYNCSGCHANGGGGIGPALMDKSWSYGGQPGNIFDSIVKGRPNGMPTWGGRIPEYQIWQLVAYVRSLSGDEPTSATAARPDAIQKSTELR